MSEYISRAFALLNVYDNVHHLMDSDTSKQDFDKLDYEIWEMRTRCNILNAMRSSLLKGELISLLARAEAAEAEVARLREVYWRLRSYATHDDGCKLNKPPRFSGPCSCGLADALKGGEA